MAITSISSEHSLTGKSLTRVDAPPLGPPTGDTYPGTPLDDIFFGGDGNDTFSGDGGNDTFNGQRGDDRIYGEADNDRLVGGTGNDLLNGGTGVDAMFGQTGSDIYVVDNPGDSLEEAADQGQDFVFASVSFTLPANVEDLQLFGRTDIDGVGNELDNEMFGNTGDLNIANRLTGGLGNDRLFGRDGIDILVGESGNDRLDGGTGADLMAGGAGDDIYFVDNAGDRVIERAGEGTDLAYTAFSERMQANLENLILTGSLNSRVFGNDDGNIIRGNVGRNVLEGNGGEDELIGAGGSDVLIGGMDMDVLRGGADPDLFVFNSTAESAVGRNRDVIQDVESVDRIDLSRIDANVTADGNQAFVYLGGREFNDRPGEVRYDNGVIRIDTTGDGVDDMQIDVANDNPLIADNFIL